MSFAIGPNIRQREVDENGAPLGGALLWTYAAGTSTPLDTYTDDTGVTPNTNPVVADAGGLFPPIYYDTTRSYKLVLQDENGAEVWTQDDVAVATPAGSGTNDLDRLVVQNI